MPETIQKKSAADSNQDILKLLVSSGKLQQSQADQIRKQAKDSGQSFFDILLKEKKVDEQTLIKTAAILFGLSERKF